MGHMAADQNFSPCVKVSNLKKGGVSSLKKGGKGIIGVYTLSCANPIEEV